LGKLKNKNFLSLIISKAVLAQNPFWLDTKQGFLVLVRLINKSWKIVKPTAASNPNHFPEKAVIFAPVLIVYTHLISSEA
jgi:hypothetical protein